MLSAILQDEEWMREINEKLERLKKESGTNSIRNDLSKGNMIFSEESSRESRYLRDGQHGVDRTETDFGDYSMSFLPEARTRAIEHVSMRRLASTPSKYDGPNQNSMCSVENSLLPCLNNLFKRNEKWSQTMADGSSKRHGCKKRSIETWPILFFSEPIAKIRSFPSSELVHGWTEEWVKYLDYISKIDIGHDAPCRQGL